MKYLLYILAAVVTFNCFAEDRCVERYSDKDHVPFPLSYYLENEPHCEVSFLGCKLSIEIKNSKFTDKAIKDYYLGLPFIKLFNYSSWEVYGEVSFGVKILYVDEVIYMYEIGALVFNAKYRDMPSNRIEFILMPDSAGDYLVFTQVYTYDGSKNQPVIMSPPSVSKIRQTKEK